MCEESKDQALRDQLQAMLTIHPERVEYRTTMFRRPHIDTKFIRLEANVDNYILELELPVDAINWPEGYRYGVDGSKVLLQYPDRLARVLAQNSAITSVHWMLWGVWGLGGDPALHRRITI